MPRVRVKQGDSPCFLALCLFFELCKKRNRPHAYQSLLIFYQSDVEVYRSLWNFISHFPGFISQIPHFISIWNSPYASRALSPQ